MIGLLDCNNFFVSCERVFNPALNEKAVVVLSNNDGCVVSRSNEAKKLGIPMGLPAFKIKEYTNPNNISVLSSNNILYHDLSQRVMSLVANEVKNLQIYSIDETFFSSPYEDDNANYEFCKDLVAKIKRYIGIPVSIGIASTCTLAKIASHIAKKTKQDQGSVYVMSNGANIESILRTTPIQDVWGIGRRNSQKLMEYGVGNAYDLTQMPTSWLRSNFSICEVRTQKELKGEKCTTINAITEGHKFITMSRSFGNLIWDKQSLAQAIASFTANCAERLRQQHCATQVISVFIRGDCHKENLDFYNNSCEIRLAIASYDTSYIVKYALMALNNIYREGYSYKKAGVIFSQIVDESQIQLNLFDTNNIAKQKKLMKVIDAVNALSGKGTITIGSESGDKKWASRLEHRAKKSESLHIYSGMGADEISLTHNEKIK